MAWSFTIDDGSTETFAEPICSDLYDKVFSSFSITQLYATIFSQGMVINAYIIRCILIWVATLLRFTNVTEETKWILVAIFYMSVFNYGFVYVMAPWDSRESGSELLQSFFGGMYTDINAFWFNDVGVMVVGTMISNAYYPLIEFFGYWALRYAFRAWDQRSFCANKPENTHCKTL